MSIHDLQALISQLGGLANAEVIVTSEVATKLTDGASDHVVRTVTKNATTLKVPVARVDRE